MSNMLLVNVLQSFADDGMSEKDIISALGSVNFGDFPKRSTKSKSISKSNGKVTAGDLILITNYSPKSMALFGVKKDDVELRNQILKPVGGKFNNNLAYGGGWIFNTKSGKDLGGKLKSANIAFSKMSRDQYEKRSDASAETNDHDSEEEDVAFTVEDLQQLSISALRKTALAAGHKNSTKMNKRELVNLLAGPTDDDSNDSSEEAPVKKSTAKKSSKSSKKIPPAKKSISKKAPPAKGRKKVKKVNVPESDDSNNSDDSGESIDPSSDSDSE